MQGQKRAEAKGPGLRSAAGWVPVVLGPPPGFFGLRFSFEFQWFLSEGWGKQGLTPPQAKFLASLSPAPNPIPSASQAQQSWEPRSSLSTEQLKVLLAAAPFTGLGTKGTVGDKRGIRGNVVEPLVSSILTVLVSGALGN